MITPITIASLKTKSLIISSTVTLFYVYTEIPNFRNFAGFFLASFLMLLNLLVIESEKYWCIEFQKSNKMKPSNEDVHRHAEKSTINKIVSVLMGVLWLYAIIILLWSNLVAISKPIGMGILLFAIFSFIYSLAIFNMQLPGYLSKRLEEYPKKRK